jgi:LuxR family transcriptional regulator, maltose regulon positive regulatory protein
MSLPILTTKLYVPPPRAKVVLRPRLFERLNEGLSRKLTLISAPAGFGKTTLVSEWVASCQQQVAWLSVEERDKNPATFLIYLVTALQTIAPKIGEGVLSALQSPQPPTTESMLTALLNEIATIPDNVVLVLDDYHTLDSKPVDDDLSFLLEHLPPRMHLVIVTREDPDLPLANLRARGQLNELRAADLRFKPDEVSEFLNCVMSLNLSSEEIAALETRTEGWIVGLQLAAISMQRNQDTASFIKSFTGSHHFILDYLVEEVLRQQPGSIQTFLLRTSILDRLCGPLCDAVLTNSAASGQEILEHLEHANLFIVPLDNERHWYRYHHLFAELLRHRLERTQSALAPKLHLKASIWFENENLIEEAVVHAIASHDWEHAADLIQNVAQRVYGQTNVTYLRNWLQSLPESVIRARPWLCVYQALAFYWTGPRDRIEEFLQLAEQTLPNSLMLEQERTRLAGYIAAIRAHLALVSGNIPRVLAMAQLALEQLPEGDYMRRWTATALGGAYWGQGNVVVSLQAFQIAKSVALQHRYPLLAVPPSCYVGMQLVKQGKLDEAEGAYREGLELATIGGGQQLPIAGFPKVKLGDVLREKNDLTEAETWLYPGVEQCVQLGHPDVLADAYVMLARLQLAQNDWPSAWVTFQKADEVAKNSPVDPFVRCWLDDCRVRLWLAKGRMEDLDSWAEASGLTVDGELSYHYDLNHINLARVLLARSRRASSAAEKHSSLHQASILLSRLLIAAEKAGWVYESIKILVLLAMVLAESSDPKAVKVLGNALILALPGGFIRIFVDEGPPMARLLSEAVAQDITPDYTRKLLSAFEAEKRKTEDKPVQNLDPSAQPLVEPLSQRELEILRLIAQGLSNRQICERIFLALDTVKGHNSRIFAKLQVQRRTEAIVRARELELL